MKACDVLSGEQIAEVVERMTTDATPAKVRAAMLRKALAGQMDFTIVTKARQFGLLPR